jgi:hypothetical protein
VIGCFFSKFGYKHFFLLLKSPGRKRSKNEIKGITEEKTDMDFVFILKHFRHVDKKVCCGGFKPHLLKNA